MGFTRSLGFAALAAASLPFFLGALGPLLGHTLAMQLFVVGSATLFAGCQAHEPGSLRRGLGAAALVASLGLLLLILPLRLPTVVVGTAVALALARNGALHGGPRARGVVCELALQGGGLALAATLAGQDTISLAIATWGYFLVQSLHPLVGGIEPERSAATGAADPFETARARLDALLE